MSQHNDPVIEEIRQGRWILSEQCGHDLRRFMERMKELDYGLQELSYHLDQFLGVRSVLPRQQRRRHCLPQTLTN